MLPESAYNPDAGSGLIPINFRPILQIHQFQQPITTHPTPNNFNSQIQGRIGSTERNKTNPNFNRDLSKMVALDVENGGLSAVMTAQRWYNNDGQLSFLSFPFFSSKK